MRATFTHVQSAIIALNINRLNLYDLKNRPSVKKGGVLPLLGAIGLSSLHGSVTANILAAIHHEGPAFVFDHFTSLVPLFPTLLTILRNLVLD